MNEPFYGDALVRFRAMANGPCRDGVDGAHFKMWCGIAADEIEKLRDQLQKQTRTTEEQE